MDEPAEGEHPSLDPAPADPPPPASVEPVPGDIVSAEPASTDVPAVDPASAEPDSTGQDSAYPPRFLSKSEQNFWAEQAALDRVAAMRRQIRRKIEDD